MDIYSTAAYYNSYNSNNTNFRKKTESTDDDEPPPPPPPLARADSDDKQSEQLLSEVTKTNTASNEKIPAIKNVPASNVPLLDPLSVIIKLAILSNKPVGTKLLIKENVIHLQEPGVFQSFSRYIFKTTKEDLQFLYNPIQLACSHYLSKEARRKSRSIVDLFICSQRGILQLTETYQDNPVIKICLNYYYVLIENYVKEIYTPLFRDDTLTPLYTDILLFQLRELWTTEKIKIVMDMISFLNDDVMANDNVKSLDIFIQNMDKHSARILQSHVS